MARLPLVRIALLGLGSDWEESLLPAVEKMASRLRVVAVYDDLSFAARIPASRLQADLTLGIRPLLWRRDVDAVLLRSLGWQGDWLLHRLQERKLPVLLGKDASLSRRQTETFHRSSVEDGTIVMPELGLRYLPVTLRMQELMATRLGKVVKLVINPYVPMLPSDRFSELPSLLDWCVSLVEAHPRHVEPAATTLTGDAEQGVSMTFDNVRSSSGRHAVEILWKREGTADGEQSERPPAPFCVLTCERGSAEIVCPSELSWMSDGKTVQEQLASDRTSMEVMLDLFARRVAGGLIPTPDLADLQRAHELAKAAQRATETGAPVSLC